MNISEDEGFFDNRQGILDRLEDIGDEASSNRPGRETLEETLEQVPDGPLGKIGGGNAVGAVGYYITDVAKVVTIPIPGARPPGFHVISHGVEDIGDAERHTVMINAATKFVAEFAAEYVVSAPSNIDFLTAEIENHKTEEVTNRSTYSTWKVVVDVADRGQA